jgi:hypothetical protein
MAVDEMTSTMSSLDGSFVRPICEFTIDEDASLEKGLPFERSVIEFVGECRRHCGVWWKLAVQAALPCSFICSDG